MSDAGYDLIDDFSLIVASFRQQYGIRIKSKEFESMSWDEFSDLLNGLNEETPLVKIVQIRLENDPEALKNFTQGQRKIRSEWHRHKAKQKSKQDINEFLKTMETAFKNYTKGD